MTKKTSLLANSFICNFAIIAAHFVVPGKNTFEGLIDRGWNKQEIWENLQDLTKQGVEMKG